MEDKVKLSYLQDDEEDEWTKSFAPPNNTVESTFSTMFCRSYFYYYTIHVKYSKREALNLIHKKLTYYLMCKD